MLHFRGHDTVRVGPTRMEKGHWPRCLLWHGWLPLLSGVNGAPCAADASESAGHLLEVALESYSSRLVSEWKSS